jgi:hypothetical protein
MLLSKRKTVRLELKSFSFDIENFRMQKCDINFDQNNKMC